ncbi:MAG TPA: hypothetical protein VEO54_11690 [Thermoanaerobaculia bacterium]|nr:hypothetical protein [Thermoanaerobaculia bacterium]
MSRSSTARAPRGADGTCRDRPRPQGGRPTWVRSIRRAHRALDASARLIASCLATVDRSERCAGRRPVRTSRNLWDASGRLVTASRRLMRAAQQIAETNEWIGREPERAAGAPERVVRATQRWIGTSVLLQATAKEVFGLHVEVIEGLETGLYVPERDPGRRPRIVLAPRPVPVRAFLRARRGRATDRISPVLRRRRRTPRPAALSVPPRTCQGRAPPFSSICPF